jgi:hypothetical protein
MGLKDLFGKTSEQIVTKQQLDNLYAEAESEGFLEQAREDKERFLPAVDFSTASNFARYGSAERYYVDAIKNIYQNYPYDGSKKEKQEWRNNSSQLDLYIYDSVYPRTTGYVNLSGSNLSVLAGFRSSSVPQFITVKGGPNAAESGEFEDSNIYDLDLNRESNLGISEYGNTVEFWFKDNINSTASYYTSSYALFDMWNGQTTSSNEYARLTIVKNNGENKFAVTYRSGSAGITNYTINHTFDPTEWHHYAFTFANSNSDLAVSLYVDGNLALQNTIAASGAIDLGYNVGNIANIGALRAGITNASAASASLGVTYGSFDEFRFWKVARTSQQIYRNWFTQVGGGSNTDDANRHLGVYLKFNEGVVDTDAANALDEICLDYSGRVSNGLINNYSLGCKSTGSAIDTYYGVTTEEQDPIIFSTNPLVVDAISTYTDLGQQHDYTNPTSIYSSLPAWITEEAQKLDSQDLSQLVQIIASYFDMLHIQIMHLARMKEVTYDATSKPKPFAKNLLSSNGFENLDIFNDVTFIEDVLSRNEQEEFNDKLHNVKNAIYQNIYNNLSYIYKTKGTEKSLRNLIRCFGVDDELIKINLYANNVVYDLETKYTYSSIAKKFVDFNDPDRYDGYIYQKRKETDGDISDDLTRNYISDNTTSINGKYIADYIPVTLQAEVIFPKKPIIESNNNQSSDFISSSLFGMHPVVETSGAIIGWDDGLKARVFAVKPFVGSKDAHFQLTGIISGYDVNLTSSVFKDVYENEKWNLAVRVKPSKYAHSNLASGSETGNYTLEFVGFNSTGDTVQNSFLVTASIDNSYMTASLRGNKNVYAGALYNDYDPAQLINKTDVKISSVRYWMDYLSDEELIAHSCEANNFGRLNPNLPPEFINSLELTTSVPLTRADTLLLHWNFFNVTSSDANGQFIVEDLVSGSADRASIFRDTSWLYELKSHKYPGFADEFYASDTNVVNKEYVFSSRKQNPENLYGNDLVKIVDTDDPIRSKDTKPTNYYISIEKSMAQVLNDEIMNWFATIGAFNNLLGEPSQKYKDQYSGLTHLRELFFSKVNSRIDFEKFFSFYKWIDSSLSMMINQLIPASANASDKIRNMVESHMLERSKYGNKLPTIEIGGEPTLGIVTSHLHYNYVEQAASGSHMTSDNEVSRYYTFKPQWLKQRAIRDDVPVNTPLAPLNDVDREILRQVINERNIDSLPTLYEVGSTAGYEGRRDLSRIFTKIYKLTPDRLHVIEDVVIPVTIENTPFSSRFVFANEVATASADTQIVSASSNFNKRGNYQHSYETVMMSGRMANNKSLEVLEGQYSSVVNILAPSGAITDRALPVRTTNKNVIVERFSAPGGKEVSSRGYLDAASEEYSVYNSLNVRNHTVRKVLNNWMANSASLNETSPSYHKVNKNPLKKNTGKIIYDNGFVVHQIPQSDAQYSWITASLLNDISSSAFFSDWNNISASYDFLSGSVSGTTIIDYVGLNSTQVKTVDTGSNTISFSGSITDLNKALLNINGPYLWTTWKQIRNAENPVVRVSREGNYVLVQDKPVELVRESLALFSGGARVKQVYYPKNMQTFTAYREPPVEFNRPMGHGVTMSDTPEITNVESSYDNNRNRFANDDLTVRTGAGIRKDPQTHDIITKLENEEIYVPQPGIKKIEYSSEIFPSNTRVGLKDVRTRPNYEDDVENTGSVVSVRTFWRDEAANRARAATTKDIYDFSDSTYEVLPEKKLLTIFNEALNNIFVISGSNKTRESLTAMDLKNTLDTSFSRESLPAYISLSTPVLQYDLTTGQMSKLGTFPSGSQGSARVVLSASDGIHVGGIDFLNPYLYKFDGTNWTGNIPAYNTYCAISSSEGIYFGTDPYGDGPRLWNGTSLSVVGDGLPSYVFSLSSGSDGVYAAGTFTGVSGSRVSKWNGTSWSALAGGLSSNVSAIVSGSDGVYAGGEFNDASGSRVSKWDGASWSALGAGVGAAVNAVISCSDGLYVGGNFTGVDGNYITKWNGSAWSALGEGRSSPVYALYSGSLGIYAGSLITSSAEDAFAVWNGSAWSTLIPQGVPYIEDIKEYNNKIYLAVRTTDYINSFASASCVEYLTKNKGDLSSFFIENSFYLKNNIFTYTKGVAKYDVENNIIKNINNGFDGKTDLFPFSKLNINCFVSGNDGIYVVGDFSGSSGQNVSKWDGTQWQSLLGITASNVLYAVASGSEGVYVGGNFHNINGGNGYVTKWNGNSWSAMDASGLVGYVTELVSGAAGLYAGGWFSGGTGGNYISIWNGSVWTPIGGGLNSPVDSLYSASSGLYAGGLFTVSGSKVSKWDGSYWTNVGTMPSGRTYAILSSSEGIYIGGDGLQSGSTYNNILKYNGTDWVTVGAGLNDIVYSLFSNSSGLYVGGDFTSGSSSNGSISLNHVARWDGNNWYQLGAPTIRNGFGVDANQTVYKLSGDNETIYMAGVISGSRSGPVIKDRYFDNFFEAFSADEILMPTPKLVFNNFIPPSSGSIDGMVITEITYDQDGNILSKQKMTGSERIQTINEGFVYEIDEVSGKKPFYDSYNEYLADIKPRSVKYSLVPE